MENQQIIKFWKALRHEEQTELRAIIPEQEIKTHHFSTEEELIDLCEKYNGKYNIYLGVNERIKNGTDGRDVKYIKIIPIDIDCNNKPASDKDLVHAQTIATEIVKDGELQGLKKPLLSFSGNGYQLFYCIPGIKVDDSNRESIDNKIQEFERRLATKYSNDVVHLDNVGDLPRIMRVPGTFNLKSKTTSILLLDEVQEDELLQDHIINLKIEQSKIFPISSELREKIESNEDIMKLFNGDIKGFKSRSEAEMSLVCKLVQIGLNKEQVFKVMSGCKMGKWQESNVQYRELTYKKAIEIITKEKLNLSNVRLEDVYTIYRKWLHIEDTKRIDIVLATYLTSTMKGTPIWLILVGSSGDGKTEQVMALKNCLGFHIEHNITSRTLVSGNPKVNDLAPELDKKVLVIPDMASILQLPPQDKGELWGQLRDLYDGYAGKSSGLGKRAKYSGLRVTLIGCSTPKIDGQILVHQDLGTREIIYRIEENEDKEKLMEFALKNEEEEEKMKDEMLQITTKFIEGKGVIRKDLEPSEIKDLMNIARFISIARASAEIDSYTNEIRNIVYPEQPTRIIKQLKRIYLALMSLDKEYKKDKALAILWHLAQSCAFPIRISIFRYFIQKHINKDYNKRFSTSWIANELKIGKKTAQRELNILWNMKLIEKDEEIEENRYQPTEYWNLNIENEFIKKYIEYITQNKFIWGRH